MKGYFVDAAARVIVPIDYKRGGLRKWLPGGITVACMFPNGDVLYVDDEALLRPVKVAFRLKERGDWQPFMSDGVLTGRDHGETTLPPDMTPEQLAEHIEWMDLGEAMQWFRERADEPATVLWTDDGQRKVLRRWGELLRTMESE